MEAVQHVDIIGGFPFVHPNCRGCGQPLTIENAWMTDGCPCNSDLGVNNFNETRWRLLMQLQQQQARNDERYRLMRAAAIQDGVAATADEFDRKCDESLSKRG